MIITYVRSSSYGTHEMCPQQYYLQYVIGLESPANKAAEKGNVVHKVLEGLACQKLAIQNGEENIYDPECFKDYTIDTGIDDLFTISYGYHKHKSANKWMPADERDCRKWIQDTLDFKDGMFNPLKRKIVAAEQHFDIIIDQDWAKYNYELPDGTRIEGQLGIKGTTDLLTDVGHGVIEMVDWKTGSRVNWAKRDRFGQPIEKDYGMLCKDPQLLIYFYAITKMFPEYKQVMVTIFFCKDGGPYTICFEPEDLLKTEEILRAKFEEIRDTQIPKLNVGKQCTQFCYFGKNQWQDTGKTICQHFKDEVELYGINNTMQKHCANYNHLTTYGAGGGQTKRA